MPDVGETLDVTSDAAVEGSGAFLQAEHFSRFSLKFVLTLTLDFQTTALQHPEVEMGVAKHRCLGVSAAVSWSSLIILDIRGHHRVKSFSCN